MGEVIVFFSKEEMAAFEAKNKIPPYVLLDYFAGGELSRIDEYKEKCPDFIIVNGSERHCRNIFFSMPEDWRAGYDDKGEGNYIAIVNSRSIEYDIKRISDNEFASEPYIPSRIWKAPVATPINNYDLINIEKDAPEAAIDGLLGRGESLLISGAAGIGKSLLVNYMAYAIANLMTLWGQYSIPSPLTSLTIQSEVDGFAQRARLKKLLSGNPTFKSDRIYTLGSACNFVECRTVGQLDDPKFQGIVKDAIKISKADVLFIDPLISFNPVDENNNTQMRRVLDSFMEGIKETGVSVIVTHHVKKDPAKNGIKTRGASAIRDWTANAIELELDRLEGGEARIKVTHDKARNFEQIDPFYITRTRDLSFELAESKATRREDERLKCVMDTLKAAGGRIEGQKEFTDAVCKAANIGDRTARERIKDARDHELILELCGGPRGQKTYLFPGE